MTQKLYPPGWYPRFLFLSEFFLMDLEFPPGQQLCGKKLRNGGFPPHPTPTPEDGVSYLVFWNVPLKGDRKITFQDQIQIGTNHFQLRNNTDRSTIKPTKYWAYWAFIEVTLCNTWCPSLSSSGECEGQECAAVWDITLNSVRNNKLDHLGLMSLYQVVSRS